MVKLSLHSEIKFETCKAETFSYAADYRDLWAVSVGIIALFEDVNRRLSGSTKSDLSVPRPKLGPSLGHGRDKPCYGVFQGRLRRDSAEMNK